MSVVRLLFASLLVLAPLTWAANGAPQAASGSASAALQALTDEYFDGWFFPNNPTSATLIGIHDYDTKIEDYSIAGQKRDEATLGSFETRLVAIDAKGLTGWQQGDLDMLLARVRSNLLVIRRERLLQTQPDVYATGITSAAFAIMERRFDTPLARLKLVIAREKQMPAILQLARRQLVNPPRIHTQVAIDQISGDVNFFRSDLPAAFAEVKDPAVLDEFNRSNAAVIAALESYGRWLRKELLPRSHGDFRLGAQTFADKLKYDEMVDIPLPRLLEIGMADLRRNQAEFARVAKQLDPAKTPHQVLAALTADHPPPGKLLDEFRGTLSGLVKFIQDAHIVDLPEAPLPILEETPPFMRATTFASMDTPGPYEKNATEAYFNVTLPDPSLTSAQTEEFMAQFNYSVIRTTAIHEAFPGHYVQFLWLHRLDDRVRTLIDVSSNSEGWAHYCEQMILDEGYAKPGVGAANERESLLLRLGQLQDALLRDARFVVGLRMHTGSMTFEQGVDFFVKEGYQSRQVGRTETTRGASDPTYLYYTLGKLQILKLRADVKARQGAAFNLQAFHDDFMKQGTAPLKVIRKAMLGDDSPTL